jgi:hypothetical protein
MRVYVERSDGEIRSLIDTDFVPAKGDWIKLGTIQFKIRERVVVYDSFGELEEVYLQE